MVKEPPYINSWSYTVVDGDDMMFEQLIYNSVLLNKRIAV